MTQKEKKTRNNLELLKQKLPLLKALISAELCVALSSRAAGEGLQTVCACFCLGAVGEP